MWSRAVSTTAYSYAKYCGIHVVNSQFRQRFTALPNIVVFMCSTGGVASSSGAASRARACRGSQSRQTGGNRPQARAIEGGVSQATAGAKENWQAGITPTHNHYHQDFINQRHMPCVAFIMFGLSCQTCNIAPSQLPSQQPHQPPRSQAIPGRMHMMATPCDQHPHACHQRPQSSGIGTAPSHDP